MKITLRSLLFCLLFILLPSTASASDSPSRTECIAPAKPGGGYDLTCKLIQTVLHQSQWLPAPMRVTYMPGGVGAVAYNTIVAQRPAEPGTLIAFSSGSLLNLAQGKFGRYHVSDVRWLATVGADYGIVAVNDDAPWKTLADLMLALKQDPRHVVVGAGGSVGSQDWMKMALLARKAGIDVRKIRYVAFEGDGEALTALMGHHVQLVSGDISTALPYLEAGKIRVLAVLSPTRLPGALAHIPTATEQGYELIWPAIRGFYLGPKVSDAAFQWWLNTLRQLSNTESFKQQRAMRGLFEFNMSGSELERYVRQQVEGYREQARLFGLAKQAETVQ